MPLIFTSGSLLNPDSISKTINRKVNFTDMYPTEIKNYTRTWTALSKIQLDSDKIGFLRDALFVDLSKSTKGCNGALIEISDYELELLKIREHCYEVVKIRATLNYNEVDALAFIIPDKTKSRKGLILKNYIKLINKGLDNFTKEFKKEFWETTETYSGEYLNGNYKIIS